MSSADPGMSAGAASLVGRAKLRVRGPWFSWVCRKLVGNGYRGGKGAGRFATVADTILEYEPTTRERRSNSVRLLDELFFDLVEGSKVDLFIEAGAKEAGASQRVIGSGSANRAVAFEANPYTFKRFAEGVIKAGVEYEHLALGEKNGPVTFRVLTRPNGKPRADGQASLMVHASQPDHVEVTVDGVSLDDYFSKDGVSCTAMWVDVEGANAVVLRGGTKTLATIQVLKIEVESRNEWVGQAWRRSEVIKFLGAQGLVPVARDRQSRFQFNIVFAAQELVDVSWFRERLDRWRSDQP